MKHDDPKLIDSLAAEYVLGTLGGRRAGDSNAGGRESGTWSGASRHGKSGSSDSP